MTFMAGVAVRDITPRKPLFLVGYPNVPRISAGVHDPLLASALYLSDGKTALLLISVDILFISRQSGEFNTAALFNSRITALHLHSTLILL